MSINGVGTIEKPLDFSRDSKQESTNNFAQYMEESREQKKIKLLINFDVNQTVTAIETKPGDHDVNSSKEEIVNRILSKISFWNWGGHRLESHYEYVYREYNKEMKREAVNNFIKTIKTMHSEQRLPEETYKEIMAKYEKMKTILKDKVIFPSVIKLIKYMRKEDLDFHIVLRSFGKDGKLIAAEIEREVPTEKFDMEGTFNEKNVTLKYKENVMMTNVSVQYLFYNFLKSNLYMHGSIVDDYSYWQKNNQSETAGKPYQIDFDDKDIVIIFADDNIETDPKSKTNIIAPLDAKKGTLISVKTLLDRKWAIAVDPYKAIVDEDYYINAFREAFKAVGKSFGSIEQWETHDVYYV